VPDCFQFIEKHCGGQLEYIKYCQTLSSNGGALVAQLLGTEVMDNKDRTLSRCFFTNVRLPFTAEQFAYADRNRVANWITDRLVFDNHTFVVVYAHAGAWWVRLSAQVYLELRDFRWIAEILGQICRRISIEGLVDAAKL
jgi:hypothetical protein